MVAISETAHEFEKSKVLRESLKEVSAVNRSGRTLLGSALLISAIGLWAVPVDDGDAAMRLIKLAISIVLMALGAMFISSISYQKALPEIQIDTQAGELRVLQNKKITTHKLDELSDVTLKDQLMTAHSATGELILSLPVRDKHTEAALRAALKSVS